MKLWGHYKISWLLAVTCLLVLCGMGAVAQTQAAPAPAATAAAPPPMATDAPLDLKPAAAPSTDDLVKGDPAGTKTGTANDVVVSDTKKGMT
ncbi:MAG TPA: hypothetical protein VEW05_18795, partial [Candidatus Polarisedimenticolia bacterium]|nr:hypothetical protein [Candidatus Polarisedimenticolia bacterium]